MYNLPLIPHPITKRKGVKASPISLESISHTPGQNAAIRFFDPQSHDDLDAMREILKGRQVKKWMDDTAQLSVSDYRDWAGTESNTSFLFAVLDARTFMNDKASPLKGFIYIYSEREEKFRVKRMEKMGFIQPSDKPRFMLEVSFAVRPLTSGEQSGSGLMSSALRQSCLQVQMLLKSDQKPEVNIFAFVDPSNVAAQRTLLASGFVKKGQMKYDSDSPDPSQFFMLSWRLLHRKIKQSLEAALTQG